MPNIKNNIQRIKDVTQYLFKWFLISLMVGVLSGSASAFFLVSLDFVTQYRENNLWLIALLPLGGLIIGLMYHYLGKEVVKGNNLILDEFHQPQQTIPIKMTPLVLLGTLITHLFGGSAGREGTAVQMGASLADQLNRWLPLTKTDRKIILITGISGGFASVFGTPLAGAIFALEVLVVGQILYAGLFPSLLTALVANYTCHAFNVGHTQYQVPLVPELSHYNLLWIVIAGILFGLTAWLFSKSAHFWTQLFQTKIKYPPLRPVVGGVILSLVVWLTSTYEFIGLGIPSIVNAFTTPNFGYEFLIKILFTTFTLGAGFKGGEVTPLFFIGATLGSALSLIMPLPIALLAAMGFVAVFAGATNTPLACTLMGIELFGMETGVFIGLACVIAYLSSGHQGIYGSQIIKSKKHHQQELENL